MAFEHYMRSGDKVLRMGYTTGTCAALATQGAVRLLLGAEEPGLLSVMTAKGILVEVEPETWHVTEATASCTVRKDAGDDSDVTDGMLVTATVRWSPEPGIHIDGGSGVGRVTKPGLDQPVGNAAINHVPRQMIRDSAIAELELAGREEEGGLEVTISVPDGEERARKTFNPMLGVVGGISIIGTSGIVAPMSEQALIDTIEVELRQKRTESDRLIITPGNYGKDFLTTYGLAGGQIPVLMFSNFLGETLDMMATMEFREVLLVGHIGKLVKVAGGVMNTHSRSADCRKEIITAHAAAAGADTEVCRRLMTAATTDSCIEIMQAASVAEQTMASIVDSIQWQLDHRVRDNFRIGAMTFSNVYGVLGITDTGQELMDKWRREGALQ